MRAIRLRFFKVMTLALAAGWVSWPLLPSLWPQPIRFFVSCVVTLVAAWLGSFWLANVMQRWQLELVNFLRMLPDKQFRERLNEVPTNGTALFAQALNQMLDQVEIQLRLGEGYQQRLSSLLENMMSGVMLLDSRGNILLVNAATEAFLGSPRKELIGRQHLAASHHYELGQLIDRCLREGGKIKEELTIYYPRERILEINMSPVMHEDGEPHGVVVVMHDITEIRRLERLRSEFVANVSHELRTPLTAVRGFAETLLDGAKEDPETLDYFLKIILAESNRLQHLIGDLLDLSKIESRQMVLELTEVSLPDLLWKVVQMVMPEAEKKGLSLQIDLPGEAEEEGRIEADADRLKQIMLNLLANALAYTGTGGEIRIILTLEEEGVLIGVQDNGVGIPARDLPNLFQRFYRVDKARSRESGGTGLGLAIVKHLVEAHHGSIEVESELGRGSLFTVRLPYRQPEEQAVRR